ncbi:MAG: formate/nitrite transporter family protein, partial [Sciscionella sp.]
GLGMGLTALGSAVILSALGQDMPRHLLASLLYPLGFVVVIVGRAQLFTENTLFPVILVLDRRKHLRNTLRLWAVVFAANIVGALLFALLMTKTSAISPDVEVALVELGDKAMTGSFAHIFWAGIAGGWIIALMAWLVTASRFTAGQVALIYLMTFVVGAADLAHCIAGSAEGLAAVLGGQVGGGTYVVWLIAATLGNTVGGVIIVSLLNYGQVIGSGSDVDQADRPLSDVEADSTAGHTLGRVLKRMVGRARGSD